MGSTYTVKTRVFEGPLDLLLELVSQRKLFVNDVSLAQVTDDFIKYISEREDYSLSESAEFILVASTLMLIKSRSLLPMLELTEDEEASIHDLEDQLVLYTRAKELAAKLKLIFGKNIIFEKTPNKNDTIVFAPDSKTNIYNLRAGLEQLITALPKKEILPKVTVRKVISLEEMIDRLAERVVKAGKLNFRDLKHKDKISTIIGFLAMLELVKRGAILATQESNGEIEISHV